MLLLMLMFGVSGAASDDQSTMGRRMWVSAGATSSHMKKLQPRPG
jgi:hypothetical protein